MQAIELNTQIQTDGLICLPEMYKNWFGKKAKLILLESEEPEANERIFQTMVDEIALVFADSSEDEIDALLTEAKKA